MKHLQVIRPIAKRLSLLSSFLPAYLLAGLARDESNALVTQEVTCPDNQARTLLRPKLVPNGLSRFFASQLEGMDDPTVQLAAAKAMGVSYRDAWDDKNKLAQLCALRVTTIDNYLRATSNYASYFRPISLADDENPVLRFSYRHEVACTYLGQDGNVISVRAAKEDKKVYPQLHLLTSQSFGYPIRDIYNGDVSSAAQATVDIGFDLGASYDLKCKTILDTVFGAFTVTGALLDRTFQANSRVILANLPTTNEIVLADNTTTPGGLATCKFRLDVIKAIKKYCTQWGAIFPDGPLAPTGVIYVPSCDASQIMDQFSPTGFYSAQIANQVLDGDYLAFDFMGQRWLIIPDVTLASGQCYPVLNKPIGELYDKPSWNREYVTPTDPQDRLRKNWEERSQTRLIGLATAAPWAVNAIRVTYHS